MIFLTLLILLLIERFGQAAAGIRKWRWLTDYNEWVATLTAKTSFNRPPVNYALVVLSLSVLVLILQRLLLPLTYDAWYYVFNVVILFYCLGPDNFYHAFAQEKDAAASQSTLDLPEDVTQANHALFAPFFWFAVLGAVGVVFYRVTERLPRNEVVSTVLDLLNWIPARLLGCTFGLVSYFITVFPIWLKYLFHSPKDNQVLLVESAKASLGEDQNAVHFVALVDRSLIVWLVILALIVLL